MAGAADGGGCLMRYAVLIIDCLQFLLLESCLMIYTTICFLLEPWEDIKKLI